MTEESRSKLSCLWQLKVPHYLGRRCPEFRSAIRPLFIAPLRTLAVVENVRQGDSQAGEQRSGQGIGGG